MSDLLFLEPKLSNTYVKPKDVFDVSPPPEHTIFYLAIIKPHMDTHTIVGPVSHFEHLLPKVQSVVSDSPPAIDKFEELIALQDLWGRRTRNEVFHTHGFDTFVVPGQRNGVYTVMKIIRETNQPVYEALPSPVFTVIAVGPLTRPRDTLASLNHPGEPGKVSGYVATTRIIASFVHAKEAAERAKMILAEMIEGKEGVTTSEFWAKRGDGGGMLMARRTGEEWEVRIVYDEQVHRRAKEGYAWEGEELGWRF